MAKGDSSDKGKVKVRVIEFEMEGSNQTLRDSIQNIVGAIGRTPQVVRIAGPAAGQASTATVNDATVAGSEEIVLDDEFVPTEPGSDTTAQRSTRPRRAARVKSPKPVSADLRSGPMPLKTFLAKSPPAIEKRYTLIAYWFKKYQNVKEVTADHIYTAFLEMGWTNLPKDAGQPLRSLKTTGWFDKGTGGGAYEINHIGEGKAIDLVKAMELPLE